MIGPFKLDVRHVAGVGSELPRVAGLGRYANGQTVEPRRVSWIARTQGDTPRDLSVPRCLRLTDPNTFDRRLSFSRRSRVHRRIRPRAYGARDLLRGQ